MGMARFPRFVLAMVTPVAVACSTATSVDPPRVDPPRACTLIGCEDGLKVDLAPDSGWPQGDYRFVIESDAVRVTCRGSLPLPSCAAGRALVCEPAVVTIVESGCALPASAHGFAQISFDPTMRPARVRVSIARGRGASEAEVAAAEIAPEYRTLQPNGPGCPPTCTQARSQVSVRF